MAASGILLVFFAGLLSSVCHAQRNVFGSCPAVPPMEQFDIAKFEGLWYVIQLFDNGVECMEWLIQNNGGQWLITETKESGAVGTYNGKLFPNKDNSGALRVSWSLNIGGSYPFTVFDTDYENYAGLFLCQTVLFYTRQQAVILSRKPTLAVDIRQTLAGSLANYGVEMSYFHRVQQSRCGRVSSDEKEGEGDEGLEQAEGGLGEGLDFFDTFFAGMDDAAEFIPV